MSNLPFDIKFAKAVGWVTGFWRRRGVKKGITPPETKPFILLTGATGGIGQSMAREFCEAGYNLLLLGRDETLINTLMLELPGSGDNEVLGFSVDLKEADLIDMIDDFLRDNNAHVEVLINNAAVGEQYTFLNSDYYELSDVLRVNIDVVTRLTHHFLPQMVERGKGAILNIASIGGLTPSPYQAVYYASKSYVIHLTESLAHEVRGKGVYIGAVLPGPTRTRFHDKINKRKSLYLTLFGEMDPDRVARATYRAMLMGLWPLITPGFLYTVLGVCLRVIPGSIMAPFMGLLYKPRRK